MTTFSLEEATHVPSVSIGYGYFRRSRDPIAMPIEWRHVSSEGQRVARMQAVNTLGCARSDAGYAPPRHAEETP
jgi:hypothetical protein